MDKISNLFINTATNTFGYTRSYTGPKRRNNKAWFGSQCRLLSSKYTEARTAYKKSKTVDNKQRLLHTSKQYKHTILKHLRKYNWKKEQKVTDLSRYDTRSF